MDRRKLPLAPDEARLGAALDRVVHRTQQEGGHRLRLALERERLDRLDVDATRNKRERLLPDSASPGCAACCRRAATLTASPVARRSSVPVTTSPVATPMRPSTASSGKASRISTAARQARRASSSCADRDPEHSHHRVADELLHRAAVALDDRLHPLEVAGKQRPDRLRVGRLPERRRADDVAEQDGHDLALLRRPCDRRCPALGAELERLGGLVAANGTNGHKPSLGTRRR